MKAFIFISFLFAVAVVGADDGAKAINDSLSRGVINADVEEISRGPFPGLYTLHLKGGKVLYATGDGKYFIHGEIYKAVNERMINVTQQQEGKGIKREIEQISDSEMIVFRAQDELVRITVFTDSSCPYCQKFHEEINDLNDAGVTVRYLAYPREGIKSEAYEVMVSVWCAENRVAALTSAIDGRSVKESVCSNPVAEQYKFGQQISIKGTPTIVFEDGRMISGFRDADFVINAAGVKN